MTSGIRLLALTLLIGLSVWLGYLLGSRTSQNELGIHSEKTEAQSLAPAATSITQPPSIEPQLSISLPAEERAHALVARIDQLAAQTDDRIISQQRLQLLYDLTRELRSGQADKFADTIRYYNLAMPRDSAGLMLESSYYARGARLRDALDSLIAAAEFPESNEQLRDIQRVQAELLGDLFDQHAAIEDWLGLSNYFESLLIRDPNNDRIRLYLAQAQARGGNTNVALETLEITGTEAGVTQQEINDLRDSLLRAEIEPIRFREEGNSLVASATLNASPIELLVDTGATKTALATSVLRQLGALPLNQSAQVMTAAGRITAQLYRVPELIVEDTLFRNPVVIALDNPPASWDGLLGMDLLRDMNVDLSNQLEPQ